MLLYNSQNNPPPAARKTFCGHLAISSIWLGIIGFLIIPLLLPSSFPTPPCILIWWVFCLLLALAALLGAKKSPSSVRPWAFVGILLNVAILIFATWLTYTTHQHPFIAYRVLCQSNLRSLRNGIVNYRLDHNNVYPPPDQWCDILNREFGPDERMFVCRSAQRNDKGRCHYAMNPDCEPNSPPDIVLLFETKPGWNQYGGSELLTFDNHNGKGANVLFNDGHVEFIKPKDATKLKWKAEANETKQPVSR